MRPVSTAHAQVQISNTEKDLGPNRRCTVRTRRYGRLEAFARERAEERHRPVFAWRTRPAEARRLARRSPVGHERRALQMQAMNALGHVEGGAAWPAPRPFRWGLPEPRSALLRRPRLMRLLLGRWQHRVTVLAGGAGLGKTTLLAQAAAENRLAPRGEDVWFDVGFGGVDGLSLTDRVVAALDLGETATADFAAVAEAIWSRAAVEICLIFDDVHALASSSASVRWLGALIHALPANGHVVLATRDEEIPLSLVGLEGDGDVLRLDESQLRFSHEELAQFAADRGIDPSRLEGTGGWPAIAELTATAGPHVCGAYLWEEVLGRLLAEQRQALTALCDLGGADDLLLSAALGRPVDLSALLMGVPLVERRTDGWAVPHSLWRTAGGLQLERLERAAIYERAARHFCERERFDAAFKLLSEGELWEQAPDLFRLACLASDRRHPLRLGQWLSASPRSVRRSAPGLLAAALHTAFTAPAGAVDPLRRAAAACRDAGDVDAELCAIAQLGRLAWFWQDPSLVGPELGRRLVELAASGHPTARALAAFGRATVADLAGDDAAVLSELADIEWAVLDPSLEIMATWLYGVVRLGMGDADAVSELVERLQMTSEPNLRIVVDGLRLRAWWAQGRVDEVLNEAPAAIDAVRAGGVASTCHLVLTNSAVLFSLAGYVTEARRCLDEAAAFAPSRPQRGQQVRAALAAASLHLADGREDEAAATLRETIEAHGLDRGIDRRGWRHLLALSYVLVPDSRSYWDGAELRGYLRTARRLAAAVVAVRSGRGRQHLLSLELPETGVIRSALPVPFAAELGAGLASLGHSDAIDLLDALGAPGRDALRALARRHGPMAKPARALLVARPAPPPCVTYIAALGPLALRREGTQRSEVVSPNLRRKRVHELLAFLIGHRSTSRTAMCAALWPDLHARASNNNLGVTLNHLLRALEPWRRPGEAAYLVRVDAQTIRLATGDHLHIDTDDFDDHLRAARQAESDGSLSLALEHLLAAVALYRGELHTELADTTWLAFEREHFRSQYVTAATRAAHLLVGHGDVSQAERIAIRALEADPWAEGAHAVLVSAAMARGDRADAHRKLERCLQVLTELGVQPSPPIQQLQQRIHAG